MENVVEKLGFFDFINMILTGLYTICCGFILSYSAGLTYAKKIVDYLIQRESLNSLLFITALFFVLAVSYILGSLLHGISEVIIQRLWKSRKRTMDHLFMGNTNEGTQDGEEHQQDSSSCEVQSTENGKEVKKQKSEGLFTGSCINNQLKRKRYETLAIELLKKKRIKRSGDEDKQNLTGEQAEYFFAYCVYYLQVKGVDGKLEMFRNIEGLMQSLIMSNFILFLIAFYSVKASLIFLILTIMFFCMREWIYHNRVRMTLALYEVVCDEERKIQGFTEENAQSPDKASAE